MPVAAVVAALDTKGAEVVYACRRLQARAVATLLIDIGVLGEPTATADVRREAVAEAAGTTLAALVAEGDRGRAMEAMARGTAAIVRRLHEEGRIDGVVGLGGSAGASVATAAMRALPIGVPKLLVSTVVNGDTRPYVGTSDLTMMYPVVDIAGLNRISRRVIDNAAGAMAGLIGAQVARDGADDSRPLVAATMFGVTTPCVSRVQARLTELGCEVLVFHATGAGGDAMEALVRSGSVDVVVDVTTTELADELAGGVCAPGPGRLDLAAGPPVPRVVSLGALDMVNFGPPDTVPDRYASRTLYRHNPEVTLLRTNAEECAELGRRIAARLACAIGPVALAIPRGGLSAIDRPGEPFAAPDADEALFAALLGALPPHVAVHDLPLHINDPDFADAIVEIARRFVPTPAGVTPRGDV
jgi:uncharacterized protein (UPF0261 family)